MGFFDSPEEEAAKKKVKAIATNLSTGLADKVDPKDYQKILIEQNQALIGLMGLMVVGQRPGLIGDAFAIIHVNQYYNNIDKYLKK